MKAPKPSASAMVTVLVCLGSTIGCGDKGTGPGGTVDVDLVGAAFSGVSGAILENDAKTSLDVLAPYMAVIAGQQAPLRQSTPTRIPASALGSTFVWDVEQVAYVQDPNRTGAPTDGVRFILYEVSQSTQRPTTPLNEIGYLDVRDFSSGDNVDVRHTAVIGGATQLTFDMTGTQTEAGYDLTVDGGLSDGTTTLGEFTYAPQVTVGGGESISIDATADPYSLSWDFVRMGAGAGGPGSDRITVQDASSGAKLEYLVDWDASYVAQSGSVIKFNGATVADVTGSGGFIDVTPRDGSGLDETDAQLLASGYFDGLTLNAVFLTFVQMAMANAGRTLPGF